MTPDWNSITNDIFGILKGSGFKLKMFDEDNQPTFEIEKSRHFYATNTSPFDKKIKSYSVMVSCQDENANSHCDIQTPKLHNPSDFNQLLSLRNYIQKNVGEKQGLSVNWYQFDHDIEPKEPVTESSDISKPWGTTRSSFQKVGNCRLIIRHTDTINEEIPGSRWRKVHKVFVETSNGERFSFLPHMRGARALARHLSEGGSILDETSKYIRGMSEDFVNLKAVSRRLRPPAQHDNRLTTVLAELHEQMRSINNELKSWSGPRGYNRMNSVQRSDPKVNQTLPDWLTHAINENCVEHLSIVERYYVGNTSPQPELNEFQDWLVNEDDTLSDEPDDEHLAQDQAKSSYADYSEQSDSSNEAFQQTLDFLIGNNDWWRSKWEENPEQTQSDLRDIVQSDEQEEVDPTLTRMKKLAGM